MIVMIIGSKEEILRQLKIDLITSDYNPILEWFNDLWSHLYVIEADVCHEDGGEFIYYRIINNVKVYIFYQDNSNKFWCNYKHYWLNFVSKFNLEYSEIQSITKMLIENSLNNSIAPNPIYTHVYNDEIYSVLNNINKRINDT